jgi:hypothetical protein
LNNDLTSSKDNEGYRKTMDVDIDGVGSGKDTAA